MPALLPKIIRTGTLEEFVLRNIGHGIALNIQIDNVKYSPELENTYYKFHEIPMLREMDSVPVPYQSYVENTHSPGDHLAPFGAHANSPVVIRITFSDLAGDKYEQLYQMGKLPDRHISIKLIS